MMDHYQITCHLLDLSIQNWHPEVTVSKRWELATGLVREYLQQTPHEPSAEARLRIAEVMALGPSWDNLSLLAYTCDLDLPHVIVSTDGEEINLTEFAEECRNCGKPEED